MTSNKAETWRSLRARMREDAKQNLETLRSRPLKPGLLATITDEERRLLSKRQQFFARKQAIRDERAPFRGSHWAATGFVDTLV